jgi:hypothetical protein
VIQSALSFQDGMYLLCSMMNENMSINSAISVSRPLCNVTLELLLARSKLFLYFLNLSLGM